MKLHILTICLDGMPTLPTLFFTFNRLKVDWHWHVIEGASDNVADTSWCQKQPARLSCDGTHEFLGMLKHHPRVSLYQKPLWRGKTEMVNHPLSHIREECVLLQCDADEIWQSWQLERLVKIFEEDSSVARAQFLCRYFVGVDIVVTSRNSYGNQTGEWLRAWRFSPGDHFSSHEPPKLIQRREGFVVNPNWLEAEGLVFDHYSWAFPNQVMYKEQFYGYADALAHWSRLQKATQFPVKLRHYLPWVDDKAMAAKLFY